jgi:pyruvate/2-oxoglutarate/acetoin dehydrogenase E1 component
MKYLNFIHSQIDEVISKKSNFLLFGENINKGSKISALASNICISPKFQILNVGNCELTHVGVGLGLMISGESSVLYVKQMDFMFLALDQIVNSYNYIRGFNNPKTSNGSFTIISYICDQGFQGPQSSFNSIDDIGSLANIPVYCLNSKADIAHVIKNKFLDDKFKIICVSQKAINSNFYFDNVEYSSNDSSIFKYQSGKKATLLCFNFGLKYLESILSNNRKINLDVDIFHINFCNDNFNEIINSVRKTKKIVIINDSKSDNKHSNKLLLEIYGSISSFKLLTIYRDNNYYYQVNSELFEINFQGLLDFIDYK